MQRLVKPEKELRKKIERLEKSIGKSLYRAVEEHGVVAKTKFAFFFSFPD